MLKLTIENFDQLPDGGPLEFVADRRGFDFGRDQHLDWTLPDQTGVISRKHCEVRFFEQAYWLFDMSTNGTFINNSTNRMQSPYRLADGDEIRVGDYIITVAIQSAGARPAAIYTESLPRTQDNASSGSIWNSDDAVPPEIDPRELMPHQREVRRAPDYPHQHVYLPPVDYSLARKPIPAPPRPVVPPAADIWGGGADTSPHNAEFAPQPVTASDSRNDGQLEHLPFRPSGSRFDDEYQPPANERAGRARIEPSAATREGEKDEAVILHRLAAGAGVSPEIFSGRDSGEVAEEIGRMLNVFCASLMRLLSARAAAKAVSGSSSHTLIQPRDNNPLKFMPTAEEALRVLLSPTTTSYLPGLRAVESGFEDIQSHQLATLTAMQRAASEVLEAISPEAVRKASDSERRPLVSVGKGRYWESFSELWEAKARAREHGMLSVFLDAFAAYYDQEMRRRKEPPRAPGGSGSAPKDL